MSVRKSDSDPDRDPDPDPDSDPDPDPAVLGEDSGVVARLAGARPELDDYVRQVMRAQVATALFGTEQTVKVGRYQLRREIGTGGGGSVFLAWDPELTREVALKLIVATEPRLRARAVAEGQALARLSHPNIVPVFDVGVEGERVYLVMELIRGESLRAFAARHSPREIIAAYRQALDGLAAAHREKLVHRDFKPDNAVMGGDGRVRVIDFGLAIEDRRDGGGAPTAIGGTPRYMSPEQGRGEPLDPATDQYAFAVSLREALAPLPSWLEPILARAQAESPAARFPSMAALGAALALDPRARWRRRAIIAVPLALGLAGYGVGQLREAAPPRCAGGGAALAPAWSDERRAALAGHLGSLATPYARVAAPQLTTAIDEYAARWTATHRASCLAHARGELAPRMYDRRQLCLASARTQLATLVELGRAIPAPRLEALTRALPELPDPAGCVALEALSAVDPPTPGQAAGVAELGVRLDRARVHGHASPADAEPELAELVRDARALGYRPLLSSALLAQGTAYLQQWKYAVAEPPLHEANVEALRSRDYPAAVEAFARLAWVRSKRPGLAPEASLEGLEQVSALADGLPAPVRFAQALLHNNVGGIQLAAGHLDRARAEYQRSIELGAAVSGPGAVELSAALQGLALTTEEPARRRELFAQRLALLRARLGDDHPATLTTRNTAALTLEDDAASLAALRPPCQRLAQLHPTHGWAISECLFELGWLEVARGDLTAARAVFESMLAVDQKPLARELAIGFAALTSGDAEAAASSLVAAARGVKLGESPTWSDSSDAASLELALGLAEEARGKADQARAAFGRARAHLEAAAAQRRWMPVLRRLAWVKARVQRMAPPGPRAR